MGCLGRSLRTRPPQSPELFLMAVRPPAVLMQAGGWGRWAAGVADSWLVSTCMRRQCRLFDGATKQFNYNLGIPEVWGVPSKSGEASNVLQPGEPRSAGDRGRRPERARRPQPLLLPAQTCSRVSCAPRCWASSAGCLLQGRKSSGSTQCTGGNLSRVPAAPAPAGSMLLGSGNALSTAAACAI